MYPGIGRRKIQETVYIKENYFINVITSYNKYTVNKWLFTKILQFIYANVYIHTCLYIYVPVRNQWKKQNP